MGQATLINVKKADNGISLTFKDDNNNEFSKIYQGNLSEENLSRLIGNRVAFHEDNFEISKAWGKDGKPNYCDDVRHGIDR